MKLGAGRAMLLALSVLSLAAQGCVLVEPIQVDRGRVDRGEADTGTADTGTTDTGTTDTGTADTGTVDTGTADTGTADTGPTYAGEVPSGMVYVPAGTFTMGSPVAEVGRDTNETQHTVTLSRGFFLGATEVAQWAWKALSGGTNPSCYQSTSGTNCTTSNANDSGPVETVDWYSAAAFANAKSAAEGLPACYTLTGCTDATNGWKDGIHSGCTGATAVGPSCTGYRLPTESEWEYAARGGTTTATYLGNLSGDPDVFDCGIAQANLDGIAWWCLNDGGRTQAVGGKRPNSFGLYDMLGNVYEWTGDWNGTYPDTVTDPTGPTTGSYRVIRGGAARGTAWGARAACRFDNAPGDREDTLGFRLARTAP